MGGLIEHIRSWAATELKYWERAALDKVAGDAELSEELYAELVDYFLQDAGLQDMPSTRPDLSFPNDMVFAASTAPCRLNRIFNLRNVNALPNSQELRFGSQLTLVYGENGAGKTGYARPLGCAAFARGEREVLPDATTPYSNRLPQVDMEISYGDKPESLTWTYGQRVPELGGFYVFDGNSLVAHLTGSNPLSFSPMGLSLLTTLAELTDQIRARVRKLIDQREAPPSFHAFFQGHSKIANLVSQLGVHTDLQALEKLSKLTADEEEESDRLEKEIATLKLRDIPKEIERRRHEIRDLRTLTDSLATTQAAVGDAVLTEVNQLINEVYERSAEVQASGSNQFTFPPFTSVGSSEWRSFLLLTIA